MITAHRQLEGGGFVVRRPFPTGGLAFVMNTESEIRQAVSDYRSGRFAEIQRA